VRSKVALSAPEAGPAIGQVDSVVAALLEKRSALAADLAVAEDAVTCLRRQITAVSETLKTFGHLEPERDRMPAAVRHKRQRVAWRRKRQRRPHSPLLIRRRGRSSGGRAFG
jgi:hypothetical protein